MRFLLLGMFFLAFSCLAGRRLILSWYVLTAPGAVVLGAMALAGLVGGVLAIRIFGQGGKIVQ